MYLMYRNLFIYDQDITTLTLTPISPLVAKTKSVENSTMTTTSTMTMMMMVMMMMIVHGCIHLFISGTSIAPLQVRYFSDRFDPDHNVDTASEGTRQSV